MKMNSIAPVIALTGVTMASAPAATAMEPVVRTSERQPQKVAALMRGFAAGHEWMLAQEPRITAEVGLPIPCPSS